MNPQAKCKGVMRKPDMPGYVSRFLTEKRDGTFYELMEKYSEDGYIIPDSPGRMMTFKDNMCGIYSEAKKAIKEREGHIPQETTKSREYGKHKQKKKYNGPKAFRFRSPGYF